MRLARVYHDENKAKKPVLRFDREVTTLEPLNKYNIKWLWYNLIDGEINAEAFGEDDTDTLLFLLLKGYLVKKSGKIFILSELGQKFYDGLKRYADKLANGIPARDKPLLYTVDSYLKCNWVRGKYIKQRRFVTDGRIVVHSRKIFNGPFLKIQNHYIKPCSEAIEEHVRKQVKAFALELDRAPTVEPYKFQRPNLFDKGRVWFKEKSGVKVYPMSEFYYDYLYAYSGKIIIDDIVKVVIFEGITIFVFQALRYTPNEVFTDHIAAYAAGLKMKEEVNSDQL